MLFSSRQFSARSAAHRGVRFSGVEPVLAFVFIALLLLITGCQPGKNGSAAVTPVTDPLMPTAAQAKLPTMKLFIGAHELEAELARTPEQIRTGMMFRTNIAETEGMLFVFGAPTRASFWMKNVPINMSCAYIDPAGTIREIREMNAHEEAAIVAASADIQFVLETARGWFERHNVQVGTTITTPRGTLRQTFFGR
jgi:uncharacterized membrane protein (UPF0127 family)